MAEIVYGITGASGQLARVATAELLDAGVGSLVLGTRDVTKLKAHRPAEVRALDFDRADTLASGLEGVESLLLVSTDHLSVPGARAVQHRRALDAAIKAGVRHIAYTSMPNPDADSPIPFAADHRQMEADLASRGVSHSVLRVSWYFENLLPLLPKVLASGIWYSSAEDGRIAYVSRADAGRAAARALLAGSGGVHDITGPDFQTVREIADTLSDVFERPIRVVDVEPSKLAGALASIGAPQSFIPMLAVTEANQREHRFTDATNVVRNLTGKRPEDWKAFLTSHRVELLARAA